MNINFKRDLVPLLILVAAVGVFCISLPLLIWQRAIPMKQFLQIVGVVVSWPAAAALIALVFFSRFREALDQFLRNVGFMKLPGGLEFQRQNPSIGDMKNDVADGSIKLSKEDQAKLEAAVGQLIQERDTHKAAGHQTEEQFRQATLLAYHWKFRFLDQFFVPSTKQVLLWFAQQVTRSRKDYHQVWGAVISDVSQRDTILEVLIHFGLLEQKDLSLSITQVGYAFLQFTGLIGANPTEMASGA